MPEPSDFWARYLLGPSDLEALVGRGARINTDDRPHRRVRGAAGPFPAR